MGHIVVPYITWQKYCPPTGDFTLAPKTMEKTRRLVPKIWFSISKHKVLDGFGGKRFQKHRAHVRESCLAASPASSAHTVTLIG